MGSDVVLNEKCVVPQCQKLVRRADLVLVSSSSLRTQGPIRRGVSLSAGRRGLSSLVTPGVMGPGVRRDDGLKRHVTSRSRGAMRPKFSRSFRSSENRGRREDRVRAAPAVSCANWVVETAHEHTGSAETLRPSPRNGFTAYAVLSPATNSFLSPSSAD
jgi:hypothetical protein